jgi:hypothetical protein
MYTTCANKYIKNPTQHSVYKKMLLKPSLNPALPSLNIPPTTYKADKLGIVFYAVPPGTQIMGTNPGGNSIILQSPAGQTVAIDATSMVPVFLPYGPRGIPPSDVLPSDFPGIQFCGTISTAMAFPFRQQPATTAGTMRLSKKNQNITLEARCKKRTRFHRPSLSVRPEKGV